MNFDFIYKSQVLNYLGLYNFKMVLVYSSYSKLAYDVTTDHMTLRFEIFWRETANWQEGNSQVWSGTIPNCVEASEVRNACRCKYAWDTLKCTEDSLGRPKVGYLLL